MTKQELIQAAKSKLLSCPFCGGKMAIIGADKREQDVMQLYHPICTECDCMLSYYDTFEEAVEACNRRASDGRKELVQSVCDSLREEFYNYDYMTDYQTGFNHGIKRAMRVMKAEGRVSDGRE